MEKGKIKGTFDFKFQNIISSIEDLFWKGKIYERIDIPALNTLRIINIRSIWILFLAGSTKQVFKLKEEEIYCQI